MLAALTIVIFVIAIGVMVVTFLGVVGNFHLSQSPYKNSMIRYVFWPVLIYVPFLLTNYQLLSLAIIVLILAIEASFFIFYRRTLFGDK